jgi:2-polyprenyl-3-methyl-5-hydroxy-6-metoxy-1,4-benzoquinol methylase
MSFATIEDLRSQLGSSPAQKPDPAYTAKMLHPIPEGKEVDRAAFILERVTGKRVLEFGATGAMHDAVVEVAAHVFGVDRENGPGVHGFDLDAIEFENNGEWETQTGLPNYDNPDIILCGEVIEHLSNPGWFLTRLHKQHPGVPVLISVPNAFTKVGSSYLAKGLENVNVDHVAWYSPRTLKTLLNRAGYDIAEFAWYHGTPPYAEGMIVMAHTRVT